MLRLVRVALFVALCLVLTGCPSPKPVGPKLAKVAGTVTLDGKPMEGGEVRFQVPGESVKIMPVTNGSFSGEAFVGKNTVDVVWEKDGPPHPMEPDKRLKVNAVAAEFSGGKSPFKPDITEAGASDLKFAVKSAPN